MVLVGAEIWESVEERGGSDHVPISVVLDLGDVVKECNSHREENLDKQLGYVKKIDPSKASAC
jgi:hypothetical protein